MSGHGKKDSMGMTGLFRRILRRLGSERGQTFILVMTVTALASVLGVMAMSSALMSMRLKGMKRTSEKNFYRLELAEEEILAGVRRDVAEYTTGSRTGTFAAGFLSGCMGIYDETALYPENESRMKSRRVAARESAEKYLADFSMTIPTGSERKPVADRTEIISVRVGDISVDERTDVILISDVSIVLTNYERDTRSEIVCDLRIAPDGMSRGYDEVVAVENWRRIG